MIAAMTNKLQYLQPIYETGLKVPVTVIEGKKEGKTVLITAGIHCTEYVGIQSVLELASELDPEEVSGRIILVYPVNVSGFAQGNPTARVPEDNENLNRVFPGKKDGSVSEQIAHVVVEEFHKKADYYIDVHGGNVSEQLAPYVYYVTATSEEVKETAKSMAKCINVPHMVGSKLGTSGSYNYAGSCGIPSILIERGCSGVWTKEEVRQYKEDIKNVMRHVGVLTDSKEAVVYEPYDIETVIYAQPKNGGFWYPKKQAGEHVVKGELAGVIRDHFGNIIESFIFGEDGVILYQTCSLCIKPGDEAIVYGVVK